MDPFTGLCSFICNEVSYYSAGNCYPCPDLCITCESSTYCLSCIDNAELSQRQCLCSAGFKPDYKSCQKVKISFSLEVDSDNTIRLSFSSAIDLTAYNINLEIEGLTNFDFRLENVSDSLWEVLLITDELIETSSLVVLTIICADLADQSKSGYLNAQPAPKTQAEQQASAVQATTSTAIVTAMTVSTIAGMTSGNMSSAWSLINTIQMLAYIPMMNIDLPIQLSSFFKALFSYNLVPNIFNYFIHDDSPRNSRSARRDDIDSTLFLVNAGQLLSSLLVGLAIAPFIWLLSIINVRRIKEFFESMLQSYCWNYFIRFALEAYLEILFASVFQVRAASTSSKTLLVNTILGFMTLCICVCLPVLVLRFVCMNYRYFDSEINRPLKDKWGSLFMEFKNDRGIASCGYYFVFLMVRIWYVGCLILLEPYPSVQISLVILMTSVSASFVLIFRPYSCRIITVNAAACEVGTCLTFFLCSLYLQDLSDSFKTAIQWTVLSLVYSMIAASVCTAFILTASNLIKMWQRWRKLKQTV